MSGQKKKATSTESSTTPRRGSKEIRMLAADIVDGKVFTDRHITKKDDVVMCFMILVLMDEKTRDSLKDVGLIYEYIAEAGPTSVNGMPTFFSMRVVHKDDIPELDMQIKRYRELKEDFHSTGTPGRAPHAPDPTQGSLLSKENANERTDQCARSTKQ